MNTICEKCLHFIQCRFADNTTLCCNHFKDEKCVIIPPVKIGDELWNIHYNKPRKWVVVYIGYNGEDFHINLYYKNKETLKTLQVDGKYIDRLYFRTKEEAEKALERSENGK